VEILDFAWIACAAAVYSRGRFFFYLKNRMLNLATESHRRYNPLKREWVVVSPQRTARPWQGRVEAIGPSNVRPYEPDCYMCPGNVRASGKRNPEYTSTFVFDNDYPALTAGVSQEMVEHGELLIAQGEPGICRVLCFSPRHDLRMPRMERAAVRGVIDVLAEQQAELGAIPWINYVLPFENHGALMGASNPHPHCQIWANTHLPNEPAQELLSTEEYFRAHNSCMLCDYAELESKRRERIVCENDFFLAVVPFWAVWPFEALVMSKQHAAGFDELSGDERDALADIQIRLTTRYDNLFQAPFAYSMGYHCKPSDGIAHPGWHFHAHYFPPLLRSATVRKFQVGYEMLGSPQRDITPEDAAERLRATSEVHYLDALDPLK
jgi:UDPglucose--hexose-1-phosphate uridylyltransferase